MNRAKEFLEDLNKAHELTTHGVWKVIAVQGNPDYSAHYGVTSNEDYPNVVRAKSDWEGYGEGSRLTDVLFITEAHAKLPVVVSALEQIIQAVEDNGSITKDELERILTFNAIYP